MGTRANIIVHRADGKWKRVYCHWGVEAGEMLSKYYATQVKAEKLVKPGNISFVAAKCSKPKGHTSKLLIEGYTAYYGRDHGREDELGTVSDTLAAVWPEPDEWIDIVYVFDKGTWSIGGEGPKHKRLSLKKVLQEEAKRAAKEMEE
jgi:hypothetical protein